MINFGEKILLFDMGEEDISVSKASLIKGAGNTSGIAIDGQSGHNMPIEIGGNDIDEVIAAQLEKRIAGREIPGTPSYGEAGHIEEKGLNSKQYLFVKNIKMAKTYFSRMNYEPYLNEVFSEGIPVDAHREVYVQTIINKTDVLQWIGIDKNLGICKQILDYINQEVKRPVNTDVTKIMLCGGLAETIGLEDAVRSKMAKTTKVVCFDYAKDRKGQFSIQKHEDSIYAAALGGAMISLKNYKIQMVLTLSYGTFLASALNGVTTRFLRLFVDKGTPISENGDTFLFPSTISGYTVAQEILSTHYTQSQISQFTNLKLTGNKELFIYEPGSTDRNRVAKAAGLEVISGAAKGNSMNIYFFVMHRGKRVKVTIPKISYIEGVRIDGNGKITPFIKTVTRSDRQDLINYYRRSGMILAQAQTKADTEIAKNEEPIYLTINNQTFKYLKCDVIIDFDKVVEFSDNQEDTYRG